MQSIHRKSIYICVYLYVFIYLYNYLYIQILYIHIVIWMHIFTHVFTYLYIYIYIYAYRYIHIFVHMYIFIYTHKYTYLYIYIYVYLYIYIHIHILVYMRIYIYIYIFICTSAIPRILPSLQLRKNPCSDMFRGVAIVHRANSCRHVWGDGLGADEWQHGLWRGSWHGGGTLRVEPQWKRHLEVDRLAKGMAVWYVPWCPASYMWVGYWAQVACWMMLDISTTRTCLPDYKPS